MDRREERCSRVDRGGLGLVSTSEVEDHFDAVRAFVDGSLDGFFPSSEWKAMCDQVFAGDLVFADQACCERKGVDGFALPRLAPVCDRADQIDFLMPDRCEIDTHPMQIHAFQNDRTTGACEAERLLERCVGADAIIDHIKPPEHRAVAKFAVVEGGSCRLGGLSKKIACMGGLSLYAFLASVDSKILSALAATKP